MHPGWVDTPGIESALPGFHSLTNTILRTPEQGAEDVVGLYMQEMIDDGFHSRHIDKYGYFYS